MIELNDATVECEICLPTRYMLSLLWRRFIGANSNAKLRIFAGRTFLIINP